MTMAFTREQHQALQEAIANGALTVDFNGRRVTCLLYTSDAADE